MAKKQKTTITVQGTPMTREKNKSLPSNNEVSIVRSSAAEYLTFVASGGSSESSLEMRYEDENIWLTQKLMAALYDVSVPAINQHLRRVFADNELEESAVVKQYLITAEDGKNYQVKHYNLQAIIAVGFKIENERAVQFRKWANRIVKDYTIQGWTMDVERLKHGGNLTDEFFERQLEKIREIRLSERKFYQKITDIYATALDYEPSATATKRFFAAVQNKMHYAVHGQTAAETIVKRADHTKENMGLTSWEGAPKDKISKCDVSIAKNYLSGFELQQMQRIVSAYLDMAELQAMRHIPMTMADWEQRLSGFLKLWDREILQDAGKVTAELAKAHAESEFEKYRIVQDRLFESDFDRLIKQLPKKDGSDE
ncbi:MAG: virulence RhuM family protein [Victivallales bacterium]